MTPSTGRGAPARGRRHGAKDYFLRPLIPTTGRPSACLGLAAPREGRARGAHAAPTARSQAAMSRCCSRSRRCGRDRPSRSPWRAARRRRDPAAQYVALGGARENRGDVARNLERWVDCGGRHPDLRQERAGAFAGAAPRLHVINALTDEEHPCQALADCLTLQRTLGRRARAGRSRLSATATTSRRRSRTRQRCSACHVHVAAPRIRAVRAEVQHDAVRGAASGAQADAVRRSGEASRRRRRLHRRVDVDGPGGRSGRRATSRSRPTRSTTR